jgi:ribose transport system ATP-binding protein
MSAPVDLATDDTVQPVLRLERISKSYGPNTVLDIADVNFFPGRVYGLLGANGSGKSTLVKVLSGFHLPDPGGRAHLRGREVAWPMRAGESGVSVVQQEYALSDSLSVLDNFLAVRSRRRPLLHKINWKKERSRAEHSLRFVGLNINPDIMVHSLSAAERALLSIGRTIEEFQDDPNDHKILVLDEPTANLGHRDVHRVLDVVRRFAAEGGVVILVNHRLVEVRAVADEVLVLRDGKVTLQDSLEGHSDADLVSAMFGSAIAASNRGNAMPGDDSPQETDSEVVFELAWSDDHPLNGGTTIRVDRGQIVGFTGLVGMGQDELPYMLFGSEDRDGLVVRAGGVAVKRGARNARKAGLVLVPGERVRDGFWMNGTVSENFTIGQLSSFTSRGIVRPRRMRAAARAMSAQWNVATPGPDAPLGSLSGGNQQKVALARAVASEPWQVLIVHEPTQGIDVAARASILNTLRDLASAGKTVLVFSADYECLAEICQRVFVMSRGQICAELNVPDITEDRLAEASMRVGETTSEIA